MTRTFKGIEMEGKEAVHHTLQITNREYFCEATAKRSLVKLSLERFKNGNRRHLLRGI